jgi:hypothetical protein
MSFMKKFLALSAILAIGGLTLAGCPSKEPAADSTGATTTTAAATPAATEASPSAAPAALDPAKIKTAILADEGLKDAKIDVKVTDKKVALTGEVKNQDLKKKAGERAKTAAPEATIINQILVK